jgi:hypothetical protein
VKIFRWYSKYGPMYEKTVETHLFLEGRELEDSVLHGILSRTGIRYLKAKCDTLSCSFFLGSYTRLELPMLGQEVRGSHSSDQELSSSCVTRIPLCRSCESNRLPGARFWVRCPRKLHCASRFVGLSQEKWPSGSSGQGPRSECLLKLNLVKKRFQQ